MSKSKAKSPKKAAPKSGLIMKNTGVGSTPSKFGMGGSSKNVSSTKKGTSVNNLPRKTG